LKGGAWFTVESLDQALLETVDNTSNRGSLGIGLAFMPKKAKKGDEKGKVQGKKCTLFLLAGLK